MNAQIIDTERKRCRISLSFDVAIFIFDGERVMIALPASVGKRKVPDVHSEIKDTIYYAIFRVRIRAGSI